MIAAVWILRALLAHVALGAVFAILFLLRGVHRIDPAAPGSTWGFRLMILPGVIAFWPWLAYRWLTGRQPPQERNDHRLAARKDPS